MNCDDRGRKSQRDCSQNGVQDGSGAEVIEGPLPEGGRSSGRRRGRWWWKNAVPACERLERRKRKSWQSPAGGDGVDGGMPVQRQRFSDPGWELVLCTLAQ